MTVWGTRFSSDRTFEKPMMRSLTKLYYNDLRKCTPCRTILFEDIEWRRCWEPHQRFRLHTQVDRKCERGAGFTFVLHDHHYKPGMEYLSYLNFFLEYETRGVHQTILRLKHRPLSSFSRRYEMGSRSAPRLGRKQKYALQPEFWDFQAKSQS